MGFFLVMPVHAQVTFFSYEDHWVQGSIKDKGFIVDSEGTNKSVEKNPMYGWIYDWDSGRNIFTSLIFEYDDVADAWSDAIPYTIQVLGADPDPLDYTGYASISPEDGVEGITLFALIMRVTAKEDDNLELKKVKGRTVGGCVIYDLGDDMYFTANETLNFKGIPPDKVVDKVPEEVILKKDAWVAAQQQQ
jgi:hypothetical protein